MMLEQQKQQMRARQQDARRLEELQQLIDKSHSMMVYKQELSDFLPAAAHKKSSKVCMVRPPLQAQPPLQTQPPLRQTSSPAPRQPAMSTVAFSAGSTFHAAKGVPQPLVTSRLRPQLGAQAQGSAAIASATISTASSSQASPTASPAAGSPMTARSPPVSGSASALSVGLPPQPVSEGRWESTVVRRRPNDSESSVSPSLGCEQASRSQSRIALLGNASFMQETECSRLRRVATTRSRSASAGRQSDALTASALHTPRTFGGSGTPRSTSPALRNPGRHLGGKLGRCEETCPGGAAGRSSRSSTPKARGVMLPETNIGQQPSRRRQGAQPLGADITGSCTSHARTSPNAEAAWTSSPGTARIGWDAPPVASLSASPAASTPAELHAVGASAAPGIQRSSSPASPKVRPPVSEDAIMSSTAVPCHCAPRSLDFEHGREQPVVEPGAGDDFTDEGTQADSPLDHSRSRRASNPVSSVTGAWASDACPCPQALASPGSREHYPRAPPPSPGANAGEQLLPAAGLPPQEEDHMQQYDCDGPPQVGEYADSVSSTSTSWADDTEGSSSVGFGGSGYHSSCCPLSPIREVSERVEAGRLTPCQANESPATETREERNNEQSSGAGPGQFSFGSDDRAGDADGPEGAFDILPPLEQYAQMRMAYLDW
eukprot:TRINITY_DN29024_c0_g3_i1.p1 TRINITY_DN29024_c0_g3~~TRINITY_DN29024_c0_g3_i1.p1  ORF type:complete len:661 (-),score=101.96 TRINITY_DN29024_c0_g3_i1:21-2003(-)